MELTPYQQKMLRQLRSGLEQDGLLTIEGVLHACDVELKSTSPSMQDDRIVAEYLLAELQAAEIHEAPATVLPQDVPMHEKPLKTPQEYGRMIDAYDGMMEDDYEGYVSRWYEAQVTAFIPEFMGEFDGNAQDNEGDVRRETVYENFYGIHVPASDALLDDVKYAVLSDEDRADAQQACSEYLINMKNRWLSSGADFKSFASRLLSVQEVFWWQAEFASRGAPNDLEAQRWTIS